MNSINYGDRIAANEHASWSRSVDELPHIGVLSIGTLVRVVQFSDPMLQTTHLVTSSLLTSSGVKYGLDGGAASCPHIYLRRLALPTDLMIKRAMRLAAENAPRLLPARPLTRPAVDGVIV